MKQKFLFSAMVALSALLGLSSCDKQQAITPDTPKESVKVEGLIIVENEDGTTQTLRSSDLLRAADDSYGTWVGLGTYPSNTSITVTFTSKSPWFTYAVYEKTKSESTGLTNTRTNAPVSRSITVTKDVTFVAKVRKIGTSVLTPKVNVSNTTIGAEGGSTHVTVHNDKSTPIVGKDGTTVGTDKENNLKPSTIVVSEKPSWVTVTTNPATGDVTITATPNNQTNRTTTSKRTGNVVVTVDGKPVTVEVSQDSKYEVPANDIQSNEWDMKTGTKPNAQYSHNYGGNGGAYDIAGLHQSFGKNPEKIIVAVYVNGTLAPKSQWKEMNATWTYGPASQNWVTNSGKIYTATKNETGHNRGASQATLQLKPQGSTKILHTCRINFTQRAEGHIVDGEIR